MRWFNDNTIREIHKRSIAQHLNAKRTVLMSGVSSSFIAGLQSAPDSSSQLLLDLRAMNSVRQIKNGEKPFLIWLRNAEQITSVYPEAKKFYGELATKVEMDEAVDATDQNSDSSSSLNAAETDTPKKNADPETLVSLNSWQWLLLFAFVLLVGLLAFYIHYLISFIIVGLAVAIVTFGIMDSTAVVAIPSVGKFGGAIAAAIGIFAILCGVFDPNEGSGIDIRGTVFIDEAKTQTAIDGSVALVGIEHPDSPAAIKNNPPGFFEFNNCKNVVGQKLRFQVSVNDPVWVDKYFVEEKLSNDGRVDLIVLPSPMVFGTIVEVIVDPIVADLKSGNPIANIAAGDVLNVQFKAVSGSISTTPDKRLLFYYVRDLAIETSTYLVKINFAAAADEIFNFDEGNILRIRGTVKEIKHESEDNQVTVTLTGCRMHETE